MPGKFGSLNILLIDDETFALSFTSRILKQLGFDTIVTAGNGADALDILNNDGTTCDVVISDIEMPEMDGFEFVRQIRYGTIPNFKDIPIIMLTGRATEDNIQLARQHKINGFVTKPPKLQDLESKLSQVLGLYPLV